MNIQGQVEWVLINKDTGEEEGRGLVKNVYTDRGIVDLMGGNISLSNRFIIIGGYPLAADRYTVALPGNQYGGSYTIQSTSWFEAVGPNPAYFEQHFRFAPPASTISIDYVALSNVDINSANIISQYGPIGASYPSFAGTWYTDAYVSFSTPCVQTPANYLDIYYRVLFPISQDNNFSPQHYRLFTKAAAGFESFYADGFFSRAFTTGFQMPTPSQLTAVQVGGIANSSGLTAATPSTGVGIGVNGSGSLFSYTSGAALGLTDHVGELLGSIGMSCFNSTGAIPGGLMIVPVSQPINKNSPIQNVFNHNAANVSPFLDPSNLATGTGTPLPSGTWSTPLCPEFHYINITNTGSATTAEYTYKKRYTTGFTPAPPPASAGTPSYLDMAMPILPLWVDNYGTNDDVYPIEKVLRQPLNSLVSSVPTIGGIPFTTSIAYDQQTILVPDADRVLKYTVPTGVFTLYNNDNFPSFNPSQITQICLDGSNNIYVADQVTGLWQITPSNVITLVTGNPGGTGCYGVCYSSTSGITALFSNSGGATGALCNITGITVASTYAFTYAGISDSNWNSVSYLVADTNTNDILIVRRWDAVNDHSLTAVWFSATGAYSPTGLTLPYEAANTGSYYGNARINKSFIKCSPNTSFWVAQYGTNQPGAQFYGSYIWQKLTPGTNTTTQLYFATSYQANYAYTSVQFEYDLATTKDVLIAGASNGAQANGWYVTQLYAITDSAVVSPSQFSSPILPADVNSSYSNGGTNGTGVQALSSGVNGGANDMFTMVKLDKGFYVTLFGAPWFNGSYISAFTTPYVFSGNSILGDVNGGTIGNIYGFRYYSWASGVGPWTEIPPLTLGSLVGGTLYTGTNTWYYNVPLTGGTGTGAIASILVNAGSVQQVVLQALGYGYLTGDTLSALNTNIGGTGSGFTINVTFQSQTPKTATASPTALTNGWSIEFVAGASEPSFVAGEYYTFGTFEGILKDNATTLNLTQICWWKKPVLNFSGLESVTIPSNTAATGIINTIASQSGGSSFSGNQLVLPYLNGSWCETQQLFRGDFDITFSSFPTPVGDFAFGVGYRDQVIWGFLYTGGTWYAINNGIYEYTLGGGNNNNVQVVSTPTMAEIIRSGTTITLKVNGSTVRGFPITTPETEVYAYVAKVQFFTTGVVAGSVLSYTGLVNGTGYPSGIYYNVPLTGGTGTGAIANLYVQFGSVQSVVPIVCGSGYTIGDTLSASNTYIGGSGSGFSIQVGTAYDGISSITMPVATVASASTSNVLRMGTSGGSSGSFDPLFAQTDQNAALQFQVTINGLPAAAVHTDAAFSLPGVGEVTIQNLGGYFSFNVVNAGQSVTSTNMMYLKNYS